MANAKLPKLPIESPYRIERAFQLRVPGKTLFKGLIISKNGEQKAHVYKLRYDAARKPVGWEEIKGDWQSANKPNAIALSVDGDVLEVTVSPRDKSMKNDGDNYPDVTYLAPGAAA